MVPITMVPNPDEVQVASFPPHQPRPFLLVDLVTLGSRASPSRFTISVLTDYSKVDVLGSWYKSDNFRPDGTGCEPPAAPTAALSPRRLRRLAPLCRALHSQGRGMQLIYAILYTYRTCPVLFAGRAGTNLGRAAGRDLVTAAHPWSHFHPWSH